MIVCVPTENSVDIVACHHNDARVLKAGQKSWSLNVAGAIPLGDAGSPAPLVGTKTVTHYLVAQGRLVH